MSAEKFDEVRIALAGGQWKSLTAADFRKMSLTDRIQLIMEKKLRYFVRGRELDASDALKG